VRRNLTSTMILCVGLTPTVQRTLFFDAFATGAVNRARETLVTASGKAVNVARVVSLLGGDATLVQLLGGASGRFVADELAMQGIATENVFAQDDAPTRTCTTLLVASDEAATELVEEARPVSADDVERVRQAVYARLSHARALCLSGSFPPQTPPTLYRDLALAALEAGVPVLVDAQRAPLQETLSAGPLLVKPNRDEALATLGLTASGDAARDARQAVRALTNAGAQWALVSMGRDGSLLGSREGETIWRITPPSVEVVNPIGSGDSLAAGTLYAHTVLRLSLPEAVVYGTACAAANCLSPTSGALTKADVERLLPLVTVSEA